MSAIEQWNGSAISSGQLSSKLVKRTGNELAEFAAEVAKSDAKLEGAAFLSGVGMTHLGTLAAVAEAVVEMHPAAAQGCAQILQAYGTGAADMIRRTLR